MQEVKWAVVARPGEMPEMVQIPQTEEEVYSFLKETVKGWVEHVGMGPKLDMWLNEEGRLIGMEVNFQTGDLVLLGWGGDVLGPVVFTSNDGMGGTVGLSMEQGDAIMKMIELIREVQGVVS